MANSESDFNQMAKTYLIIFSAVIAIYGCPSRARAAEHPASPASAVSTNTDEENVEADDDPSARLNDADLRYAEALSLFEQGDSAAGKTRLKEALNLVVDSLDDDDLPASLHVEFAAMLDKIRSWQGPEEEGESASDLDVTLGTATVRVEALKLDADNPIAQKFIDIYSKRRPKSVTDALSRSGRYRDMILAELKTQGLPPDLLYLVMTESEFKYDAVSHSGAAGLWQLMPETARKYGLEVSYWIDERYDPEKSTHAATRYLSDLYRWFGDWDLAIAAYNRGEGGLGRDMHLSRSADFDSLSGRKILPEETHLYVPKFTACAMIGRDPAKYGLHPVYEKPETYDTISLPRDLDLGVAARCAGSKEADLRRLNPQLRSWCTPKNRAGFSLRLPEGSRDQFSANLAKVSDWNPGPTMLRYRVRPGDYLGRIARLNHTTVQGILGTNKIRNAKLIHPGMVLLIRPGRAGRRRSVGLVRPGKGRTGQRAS
jgi:soluble lytic murein transglycosylase-like protein